MSLKKPYAVVQVTDGQRVAAHYRDLYQTDSLDRPELLETAREYEQAGYVEQDVAKWLTEAEALVDVDERRTANRLPGVTFHSEYWG